MSKDNRLIVSKFGGSSMADATAMNRSAAIVAGQKSSVVVVSATYGTTNQIIEAAGHAENGRKPEADAIVKQIRDKHYEIADELGASDAVRDSLEELLMEFESLLTDLQNFPDQSLRIRDAIYGIGERLSSRLFTECLEKHGLSSRYFDAASIIRTDDRYSRATPVFDEVERLSNEHLKPLVEAATPETIVTQGFIGSTALGIRTTLGRGGSDYSAAIMAWALQADVLEIWTDVGGVATTDPRITPEARPIRELSFQEAAELATFGAKILHPSMLIPAIWRETPVYVGSSINPEEGGTWIYRDVGEAPLVRAVTIRRKQSLLTITTPDMLNTYGFLHKVFKVFNDHRVSVDSITTSEISVAMTVDDVTLEDHDMLRELEELGRLHIEKSYELVAVIGNNINHTAGLARKMFKALADINVRMICQGASKHNFCVLVDEGRGEEAVRRLHAKLIEGDVD